MKTPACLRLLLLGAALAPALRAADPLNDVYLLGPDSAPQPGVPQGTVTPWEQLPSQAYPGTLHDFCVYVPAQYDPKVPAALMIFQDGQAWRRETGEMRATFVFDNLIYRREVPVTIVVFINPGRTKDQAVASQTNWGDKGSNRPQEYNALDDKYARVITDELMPVLARRYTLSPDPDDHAIGGASSGAIAAFTVAWHRPDQFHKVLSTIGSFTNIRGGDAYPDLIRQAERKPIRVYLLDGVNDNRGLRPGAPIESYNPRMDWHAQNLRMAQALTDKGYDLAYCWGSGTHNNRQAGAALPEMLRWLWRDHPRVDDPRDPASRRLLTVPAGSAPAAAVSPTLEPVPPPGRP
jgi:enterochelin esterase family protein